MRLSECLPKTDWFGIGFGFLLLLIGGILTLTWAGAVIGIPLVLLSMPLFVNTKTLRGTPCAP